MSTEASLVYRASSRTGFKATEKSCLKTKQNKNLPSRLVSLDTWEVERGKLEVQGLPDVQSEFKSSLGYRLRPRLNMKR